MPETPPPPPPPPTSALGTSGTLPSSQVAPLLRGTNAGYQLGNATRVIRADATKALKNQGTYNYLHYNAHSYTFTVNGVSTTVSVPTFHFINYSSSDQQLISKVIDLINHALANQDPGAQFLAALEVRV
mgnify:CR=1 FL=1